MMIFSYLSVQKYLKMYKEIACSTEDEIFLFIPRVIYV